MSKLPVKYKPVKPPQSAQRRRVIPSWVAKYIVPLLILGVACILLLANLGDQRMWQDEAQTALISRTILAHGIPLGYDGRNSFSQDLGADYGKNYVWLWHPWLSFYVLAGFFAAFGENTFVARLPFALFGVATVMLLLMFTRRLAHNRRAGILAAVLMLLNVPFLLLARQCRYYSLDMFFPLLALYGYLGIIKDHKYSRAIFFIGVLATFHVHYVHCAAVLATVITHALIFHRRKLKSLLLLSASVLLVNTPWIIWFARMAKTVQKTGGFGSNFSEYARLFTLNLVVWVLPLLLTISLLLVTSVRFLLFKRLETPTRITFSGVTALLLFIAWTIIGLSISSIGSFFRFIAPLIPICCAMAALLMDEVISAFRAVGIVVVCALLCMAAVFSPMRNYLYEITHHYVGPIDGIVSYLNQHARKSDVVAITYGDMPVKFYTGLRVIGGLTGEDPTPAKTADWIIIRNSTNNSKDAAFKQYLHENVRMDDYIPIQIHVSDIPFQNRENPQEHLYRTINGPPYVMILKRKLH